MEYEIVITKQQKNPDYKPGNTYYAEYDKPREFITHKVLETVVSEEEFKAIKKACLEVM